MKRIKRLFLILVTLVCVLGLSVSSFAYVTVSPDSLPVLVQSGDHYKLVCDIPISEQSSAVQDYWANFIKAFTTSSNGIPVVVAEENSGGVYAVFFTYIPVGKNYTYKVSVNRPYLALSDGSALRCLRVFFKGGSVTGMDFYDLGSTGLFFIGTNGNASSPEACILIAPGLTNLPANAHKADISRLEISDDLNPEPPEPEVPDESVPDIPPPPPYNPTPPVVPKGNEYVLYDTDVWNTAIGHIKKNVGSATNIGLLIFMFIMIWSIFTRIFRNYTKPH